jgi:hypothetical protein
MTVVLSLLVSLLLQTNSLFAQSSKAKQKILIDIAHGQKFYNDPLDMRKILPLWKESNT